MQAANKHSLVRSYRNLYKAGLRAVSYAVPERYVVRDQLRRSFRDGPLGTFDEMRIKNTVGFLDQASKARGIEWKMLKSILHVRYWQRINVRSTANAWGKGKTDHSRIARISQQRKDGYKAFENALKIVNDNHQLCLG